MSIGTRVRSRLASTREADAGTTLAELMVGMGVMMIFMTVFTGVIVLMYGASSHAESTSVTSGNLSTAFIKLDKMIRYASALSTPSTTPSATGMYYAEFQTSNTGATVCTQLQLSTSTQTLSSRTWIPTGSGGTSSLTSFVPLATGVNYTATPFQMTASGSLDYEQLAVSLNAAYAKSSAAMSTTFTALNSNASSKAARTTPSQPTTVCQEAGRP